MRIVSVVVSLGIAMAAVAAETPPSEDLDEVVIHASLRSEAVSQLPTSATVLGNRTLNLAGVQHFEDVLGLVPNLNWSAGTSRPRYFQLRGIGELDQFQGAPNASVGFLIDDIDFSGIGMPATLYDLDQVEVLRGPQGTTYGANALAGLISVRSRDPRAEPEFRAEATGGDFNTYGIGAVAGGALGSSGASYRLVAQKYSSDGFRRDAFLGRNDTNGYDESTLRAKLHWQASDALKLDLTGLYVDLNNGYDAFAIDNSRTTQSDRPGRDAQRSFGAAAHTEYTGFYQFVLRNVMTYADSRIDYSYDADWGNNAFWGVNAPYDYFQEFPRRRQTWSEELRLISAPGAELWGHATWVTGIYALHARERDAEIDFSSNSPNLVPLDELTPYVDLHSRYSSTNYATYGEIDTALTSRLRLSAGTRVERRIAHYRDSNGQSFDPAETMLGGHLSLELAAAQRRNVYLTLSRGYKAGGFNIGTEVPVGREQFDAEYLWNLETGLKATSEDGRLSLQSDVFYMRRTNQQVSTSVQPDPQNPASFIFFIDNAAHGENYGLESAVIWQTTQRWQLGGSLGLLHTRYLGYEAGGRSLDGREQAHAPQYQLALSGQYRHPTGFIARVDTQSVDDFYFDTSHDQRSRAYTLVNLKLGFERSRWAAYAWARNLFDEGYAMRGFFFGVEPPDYPDKRYVQAGDPRQVGVTFKYSFR